MHHVACFQKQVGAFCVLAQNLVAIHHLEGLGICNKISVQRGSWG
jgi:hypothetical protein